MLYFHKHAGDPSVVAAKILKGKIMKKAKKTDDKPAVVINRVLRGVLSPVSAVMPKPVSLSRSVNRIRVKDNPQLHNPSFRGDLELTDEFKHTYSGDLFLLRDSGGNKKRFIIFTTQKNLNYLSSCEQWLGDGTFKSVPGIFNQLYSIYGYKDGKSLPLVYMLAPDKSQCTYVNFLKILRQSLPNFIPNNMMIDFEEAFIGAFTKIHSGVKLSGCYFHFNQCVWRQIQACKLQKLYDTNITFALNVRLLVALAFSPTADVIESYELIVASEYYEQNSDQLEE
ncbi:uncharacterized protein LOC123267990 [Cotesia glomerata]|uniref:uncharacterized protein LOC123267990 n=1 Tax=Cotesia glomerata TaxID=32391 RepID=UPI001D020FBF|nr:uncharacterized protein LOC123267990 [Cotesia glomerata]